MDREEERRQWFEIAANDWKIAEHVLTCFHPVPLEQVCNLAHQSAEKDLKGFLFVHGIDPPKIHDLPPLRAMCEDIDPSFAELNRQCGYLTKFGVMPRYPNELQLTDDDAKTAVRFAKEVKDFINKKLTA